MFLTHVYSVYGHVICIDLRGQKISMKVINMSEEVVIKGIVDFTLRED